MYLEVSPAGGKFWRFKYRYGGKEKRLSLGTYPEVALTEAREKRDAFHNLLANGIEPSANVKAERAAQRTKEACVWPQPVSLSTTRVRCLSG